MSKSTTEEIRDEFVKSRAPQLWCLPEHSSKEMDVAFAKSVQALVREAIGRAVAAAVYDVRVNEVEPLQRKFDEIRLERSWRTNPRQNGSVIYR